MNNSSLVFTPATQKAQAKIAELEAENVRLRALVARQAPPEPLR
jgi:hypothetical protein